MTRKWFPSATWSLCYWFCPFVQAASLSSAHLGALTANTGCGLWKGYIKIIIIIHTVPKVHAGTTALKNAEAQVCSKDHYVNRKIPIDFSGLRSQPKLGLEPNSLSPCQCTCTELYSWPGTPKQEQQSAQEKVQGWKSRQWEQKAKDEGWAGQACGQ